MEEVTDFGKLMYEHARMKFMDGHLWFSVFARQPQSGFSRVQRVSCVLCLLYTTMLANAMFYKAGKTGDQGHAWYSFGPFMLSPEQVGN